MISTNFCCALNWATKCIFETAIAEKCSQCYKRDAVCFSRAALAMHAVFEIWCARVAAADAAAESGKKRRVWVCCWCRRPQSAHAASADGKLGAQMVWAIAKWHHIYSVWRLGRIFIYMYIYSNTHTERARHSDECTTYNTNSHTEHKHHSTESPPSTDANSLFFCFLVINFRAQPLQFSIHPNLRKKLIGSKLLI